MPVVTSKQKSEEPGEIAAGTPLNGNKFRKSLEAFRNHHDNCARRRRNGLDHEIRVEAQRSEWLSRKLLDNLRQQQTLPGARQESASRSQLSSCSDSDTMVSQANKFLRYEFVTPHYLTYLSTNHYMQPLQLL